MNIGLDIDGVLADFFGHYCKRFNIPLEAADNWDFDPLIGERFKELGYGFWSTMPRLINPKSLKFTPSCYITSRYIPCDWSREWLHLNGFPDAPLYTVGLNMNKIQAANESGTKYFVDDHIKNYLELREGRIECFLLDALHNRHTNVGEHRIFTINEVLEKI